MKTGPLIFRGAVGAFALWLFMQWQGIGAPWPALCSFLLCAAGVELMLEASRRATERRRAPQVALRGGRRRSDPPGPNPFKRFS
jgi:hypothetical protein